MHGRCVIWLRLLAGAGLHGQTTGACLPCNPPRGTGRRQVTRSLCNPAPDTGRPQITRSNDLLYIKPTIVHLITWDAQGLKGLDVNLAPALTEAPTEFQSAGVTSVPYPLCLWGGVFPLSSAVFASIVCSCCSCCCCCCSCCCLDPPLFVQPAKSSEKVAS